MSRLFTFSRFEEPSARDERAFCQGSCNREFHYEDLDPETGLCRDCSPDPKEEHEED